MQRSYPYDEQPHPAYTDNPAYPANAQSQSPTSSIHPQASSHRSQYQRQHGSSPYYIPPLPLTMTPPPAHGPGQYTRGAIINNQAQRVAETGYYRSSVASPNREFSSPTPGYHQAPLNHDIQNPAFIPTPSDIARSYPNYAPGPSQMYNHQQPFQETSDRALRGDHNPVRPSTSHSATQLIVPPQNISTPQPSPATASTSERYRCDKCGKTFSRSHDRKRHYETQHHPVPAIHRCRFCEKEFSRSDSLKRHVDNGCDEMR